MANYEAYRRFPADPALRLNLALTFATVLNTRPAVIEPAAADKIHAIAQSAGGENVGVALGRFDYLMTSGRHSDAEAVLDGIRGHAEMQSGYWLARAALGLVRGQDVKEYARRGLRVVDRSSPHRAVLEELAK